MIVSGSLQQRIQLHRVHQRLFISVQRVICCLSFQYLGNSSFVVRFHGFRQFCDQSGDRFHILNDLQSFLQLIDLCLHILLIRIGVVAAIGLQRIFHGGDGLLNIILLRKLHIFGCGVQGILHLVSGQNLQGFLDPVKECFCFFLRLGQFCLFLFGQLIGFQKFLYILKNFFNLFLLGIVDGFDLGTVNLSSIQYDHQLTGNAMDVIVSGHIVAASGNLNRRGDSAVFRNDGGAGGQGHCGILAIQQANHIVSIRCDLTAIGNGLITNGNEQITGADAGIHFLNAVDSIVGSVRAVEIVGHIDDLIGTHIGIFKGARNAEQHFLGRNHTV